MNEENSLRWETESSFWLNVVKVEVNFEERIRLAMDGREQRRFSYRHFADPFHRCGEEDMFV